MGGGVGSPFPRGEAGPGFPDTPENRERMARAAANLGIPGAEEASVPPTTDAEFLGELRSEVMDAARRFDEEESGLDRTVREFYARGEFPYDAIDRE